MTKLRNEIEKVWIKEANTGMTGEQFEKLILKYMRKAFRMGSKSHAAYLNGDGKYRGFNQWLKDNNIEL